MPVDTTSPCPVATVKISSSAMSPPPLRRRFPCPAARYPVIPPVVGLPEPVSLQGSCTENFARKQCPQRALVGIIQALWEALHTHRVGHFLLREQTWLVYDRRDGDIHSVVIFERALEYS